MDNMDNSFKIRLSTEDRAKLTALAQARRTSCAAVIRHLIAGEYYDLRDPDAPDDLDNLDVNGHVWIPFDYHLHFYNRSTP